MGVFVRGMFMEVFVRGMYVGVLLVKGTWVSLLGKYTWDIFARETRSQTTSVNIQQSSSDNFQVLEI